VLDTARVPGDAAAHSFSRALQGAVLGVVRVAVGDCSITACSEMRPHHNLPRAVCRMEAGEDRTGNRVSFPLASEDCFPEKVILTYYLEFATNIDNKVFWTWID